MPREESPLQSKLHRAAALLREGQLEEARVLGEEILKAQPKHAPTLNLLGVIATQSGDAKKAAVLFAKAIASDPTSVTAYSNRGVALRDLGDLAGALASLDQALVLRADYAEAHFNRGNVLRSLGRLPEALANFDRAIACWSAYGEAHTARGVVLGEMGRFDEARSSLDRAIEMRPDYAPAYWNRAQVRLLTGDLASGWLDYEWRWRLGGRGAVPPRYARRLWSGEPLLGKRILLYAEQGFGDTIQFCRYVASLAALGAQITLEVQEPLIGLLSQLPGVVAVDRAVEDPTEFDFQCPLMSLPRVLGTRLDSIPNAHPYLRSDPERVARWRERLGKTTGARVGLVWSGRRSHTQDRHRSITLAEWLPHLPAGFQYVSLQKELREADRKSLRARSEILDVTRELSDFAETAALCDCMDLIITVDTSVAHLAGALGKRTWVLLPFVPDWRWLLERRDSPWYPTILLHRQAALGEWAPVLERIRVDLVAMAPMAP